MRRSTAKSQLAILQVCFMIADCPAYKNLDHLFVAIDGMIGVR